jgi:hypothetical protein
MKHRPIEFYVVGENTETMQLHPETFGFAFVPRKDDVIVIETDHYEITCVWLDYEACKIKIFGRKL